jgi:SAM-dependent methyltransferase
VIATLQHKSYTSDKSRMPSNQPHFEDLTETTGIALSPEGAQMMFTRYSVARELSAGQRVLEIGCGSGQGLGMISGAAASTVGSDFSMPLLREARAHYGSRVPLVRLSADALPFRRGSFDVILCFEASYYIPDMARALDDIAAALAPNGVVMFVNANPERPDFIPSPHSIHYHSADEFRVALEQRGFTVRVFGAFPVLQSNSGLMKRAIGGGMSIARRVLEGLSLVPRTLRGRARLKRLVYRRLPTVPSELRAGFSDVAERTALLTGPQSGYKVVYVHAIRQS